MKLTACFFKIKEFYNLLSRLCKYMLTKLEHNCDTLQTRWGESYLTCLANQAGKDISGVTYHYLELRASVRTLRIKWERKTGCIDLQMGPCISVQHACSIIHWNKTKCGFFCSFCSHSSVAVCNCGLTLSNITQMDADRLDGCRL